MTNNFTPAKAGQQSKRLSKEEYAEKMKAEKEAVYQMAPEPPHTSVFKFLRCFFALSPIQTFCVISLFAEAGDCLYFLFTALALPHFAEPCSSRLR